MSLGPYAVEQNYSHYVAYAAKTIHAIVGTATKGPVGVPTVCTSVQDFINKFGPVDPSCLGLYAGQYFLRQASKLWFVRAASKDVAAATVTIPGVDSTGSEVADAVVIKAKTPGTYYNSYSVVISESKVEGACTISIKNGNSYTVETRADRTMEDISECDSAYFEIASKNDSAVELTAGTYNFVGGNDGINNIESGDYITAAKSLETDNVDMNLLAVPGVSDAEVIVAMLELAEHRGDCLYLVDPPAGLSVEGVINWHNGEGDYEHARFSSSYGALYYDWQRIYDNVNKVNINLPPSAVAAATFAYSDRVSEVWYPPAGLKRGLVSGVLNPVTSPDSAQTNLMYEGSNSINAIIEDPQSGICIFGQKTLAREDSALNRVNVRRLLNYLKRVITGACRYLTFEPNDRVTWNSFEDLIEPTLKSIKNRRGLYDYRIIKGTQIVTDADIDNYTMPCKIMLKPTKSAEYIPIYFTITSTGADFQDVLEADGIDITNLATNVEESV